METGRIYIEFRVLERWRSTGQFCELVHGECSFTAHGDRTLSRPPSVHGARYHNKTKLNECWNTTESYSRTCLLGLAAYTLWSGVIVRQSAIDSKYVAINGLACKLISYSQLNHTQFVLVLFSQLSAAAVPYTKANDGVSPRSKRGSNLSTIPHCLEWYKLVLLTRLPIPAVQYLVLIQTSEVFLSIEVRQPRKAINGCCVDQTSVNENSNNNVNDAATAQIPGVFLFFIANFFVLPLMFHLHCDALNNVWSVSVLRHFAMATRLLGLSRVVCRRASKDSRVKITWCSRHHDVDH